MDWDVEAAKLGYTKGSDGKWSKPGSDDKFDTSREAVESEDDSEE